MDIIKNTSFKKSAWPGGTTTQLFIYPAEADYSKRNFLFRLSTATVEAEKSDFTSLTGFKRKLMILDGELTIHHKGHYNKHLKKFEQDEFDGDWETSAEGKVTDFNLMMADVVDGSLEHLVLDKDQRSPVEMNKFSFIYLYKGAIDVGGQSLEQGDLVCIEDPQEVSVVAAERSELIICTARVK